MKFQPLHTPPQEAAADCIVVGVTPQGLSGHAQTLDTLSGGAIGRALAAKDIEGKAGEAQYLYGLAGVKSPRVLLLGADKPAKRDGWRWRKMLQTAAERLQSGGSRSAAFFLDDLAVKGRDAEWKLQTAARVLENAVYRKDGLKSDAKKTKNPLTQVGFYAGDGGGAAAKAATKALARGKAIGEGMAFARRLGDLPPNVATPAYLASQAEALAKRYGAVTTKALSQADMEKLGMGALLSVAAGAARPAKLILVEYHGGKKNAAPVALVGKGVTFDSGGISLKPGAAMDEMKYDMCGAASVLGSMQAAAALKLPINIVGAIPATENMPGGKATRPGDIVTAMCGKTIEVLNTDAEGRLILCDALTYIKRYKPSAVIDIATLTGAVIVALGNHIAGLMGNNDKLCGEILAAGETAQDNVWRLPLDEKFQRQLDSNFADMANIGGRPAGTITAACFLSRFTDGLNWAHLDIAGTAWTGGTGKTKGASGRPVPLLAQFLIDRCG